MGPARSLPPGAAVASPIPPPDLQPSISVNLSGKQLCGNESIEELKRVLQEAGLDPAALNLEMTECVLIENTDAARLLVECKNRQVHVHMADFGTGYYSLSTLHNLAIDAVKLDKTFVQNMSDDGKHAATVQAMIVLAINRGFKVIAEGVECREDLLPLQTLDCHMAQGYYISKPVLSDAAETMLTGGGHWQKIAKEDHVVNDAVG